jgi:5-methylcytosine-specific restriction endonuclease McrA
MNISKYKYSNLKGFAKKSIDEYKKFIKDNTKKKLKNKVKKRTKQVSKHKKRYLKYLDSKEWSDIKIDIRIIKDNKCEICNSTKNLQVHHKTYKNLFKEEPIDLMLVCDVCHKKIHKIAV